ncbi:MAG: prepilin-type N-terminal cleavage/methylation domain-containing protein [Patescibacteria group bacterium]|nr:prepilin-type N-terminal cleavage/methylation domain-containing protein [Patescibacteria group bacterium]
MKNIFKKENGLTAIEVIIAIGIIALISGALYGFVKISLKAQQKSFAEIKAGNEARKAMLSMADNLRDVVQSETGGYPIKNAGNQTITFYSNIDQDDEVEQVRYFLSGTNLNMEVTEPQGTPLIYPNGQEVVKTVARYIQNGANPIFYYYDMNYTGTQSAINPSNIGEIRLIKIVIIVDANPNSNPPPTTMETEVQLRNLKDNL